MKKIVSLSLVAFFSAATFILQGCKKETAVNQPDNGHVHALQRQGNPAHRQVVNNNFDCAEPAVNCLDDVIIRPQRFDDLKAAAGNGAEAVGHFFLDKDNIALVDDVVSDGILTNMQSGDYGLIVKDYSNDIKPHALLLAGPASTLSEDNFEFAFSLLIKE